MAKYRITSIPQYKNGGGPTDCDPGYYWNGKACVKDYGNPLYQNNALNKGSLIDQKIKTTEGKGMAYQATSDELKRLYAQRAQEKAKQDAIYRKAANQKKRDALAKQQLIEQEFNAQINPNKTYSETVGTVAGNAGAAQTQGALDVQIGAKQEYHQKRKFVTDNYLNTNREALVNEAARSIQNSSNLTYEQALEQAKQDEALLYTLAEKHTPTDSEHLTNLANSQDFYDYKNSRNDQIKSIDPNDPTHISFEDPGTLGGYINQAKDIVFNPLDAVHYAMSNEKMPYNFSEYEKMKQQTGYRDGADNNAVMGAIDFASWFHPVGLYGQGMKMIEPTAESILNVYNNPTWENAGNAAFDVGMNALTFLGAKNPLKFLAEESAAINAAREAEVYEFGSKLNKFNRETYTGPQYYSEQPIQKSLLLESGSVAPGPGPALLPIGVATEVGAKAGVTTGTTPLLNITPIGFNPKMEIEGATVYNKLLEQKRLKDIAELSKSSSSSDPVAINLEAQIAKLKEQEALAEESRKVLWNDYKANNITAEEYTAGAKELNPGLEGTNPRFELEEQLKNLKADESKNIISEIPQENILKSKDQLGKDVRTFENNLGSNNEGVYNLNDDYVAKITRHGFSDESNMLVAYADKIKSPRTAKVVQIKEIEGKVYQVQNKATGIPITELSEAELLNIPKEHIDNFWKDKAELDELGLSLDISGGKYDSNIFYDPEKGFQIIDLGIGKGPANEVIAQTYKGLKLPIEETGLVKNVSRTTPLAQEEKVFGMTPTETIPSSTDAKNQFLKDLQNDPEYIGFKENATIRDQEGKAQSSFGVPNSITKDQFKNAGNTDETIFGATPTETIESSNTVPRKNLNDPEYVDDEVVADIIDDMRVNKMELWETPEGKRRLQKMIDNTESLKSNNVTPESIVERMRSLDVTNRIRANSENKLKALDEEEDLIDFLYDDGHMDKTDWMNRSIDIEEARQAQNLIIDGVNERMRKSSAFYSNRNIVGIRPKDYNKNELDIVTAHEFGHFLAEGNTTYLDDMLNDLTLIDNTSAQLTIPGIGGGTESKAAARFGHDRPNYLEESLDYFKNGSEGTEKVPFLSEVRKAMLKDGTIKHEFDKITPEMLKKHYDKYKKNNDEKYPIRLYDIIKDNKKNFTVMSKVLDHLPIVLQAVGMADALFGQEDVDTKEAGFSILLGAITRGKGKALKFGKNLKKYTGLMHEAYAPKIFTSEMPNLDKLSKIRDTKNKEIWGIIKSPEVDALEKQIKTLSAKIAASPIIGSKFNPSTSSVVDLYIKNKELDKLKIQLNTIKKTEEGIQVKNNSSLEYVTDTGQKPVISFRTKEPVIANVAIPTKTSVYTLEGKDVVFKHHEVLNPEISQNYVDVLSDNISIVEETGAKVIGSAVGVVEGGLTHLTGDIDAIILDTDYAKNVLNKLDFVGPNGPAKVHDIGINNGKEGHIDFNVIKTNPDGTVGVTWQEGNMGTYRSLEMELFRQFFPDEYYKLQKELIQKSPKLRGEGDPIDVTKMNIKIPIQADVFIKKIDPAVKTIVDAYESSKLKHINRIDTYINYGNVDVVNRAQETYVKSLVGSKGTVGPQLSTEALSDVNANIQALQQMRFIGDANFVAKDPKRMQLALNDYYINHTVHNRNISIGGLNRNLEIAFKKWQGANSSNSGGSAMGWGLNTTKLGDTGHPGNIAGQLQYGIKTETENVIDYVNSIDWATTSVAFNKSELSMVRDIIASHSTPEFAEEQMVNIQESGDLLAMHSSRFTDKKSPLTGLSITEKVDIQKIFNDITKNMGIRSTSRYKDSTYGKSYYSSILGDFDEAIDLLEYSILSSALKPKSLFERRDNYNINKTNSGVAHDPFLIESFKDYKRIEGYLSEGFAKAQTRAKQQTAYIVKLQEEQALLAEKLMYKRNPAYKKIVDDIAKGKADLKKIDDEIEETFKRLDAISNFRRKTKPLLFAAGLAAFATAGITYYSNHNKEINKFRDDMLEIDKRKVEDIKIRNEIEEYEKNNPNPRDIDIQIEKWQKKGDTNKTIKKQKTGGQIDDYFEIDIPKEDLQKYLDHGYNVQQI